MSETDHKRYINNKTTTNKLSEKDKDHKQCMKNKTSKKKKREEKKNQKKNHCVKTTAKPCPAQMGLLSRSGPLDQQHFESDFCSAASAIAETPSQANPPSTYAEHCC